jgi:hypothetical protein
MSDLTPRSGGRMSRSQRERRAYNLVKTGSAGAIAVVVGVILAIVGVGIGSTIAIIGLVIAVICAIMFRRMAGR